MDNASTPPAEASAQPAADIPEGVQETLSAPTTEPTAAEEQTGSTADTNLAPPSQADSGSSPAQVPAQKASTDPASQPTPSDDTVPLETGAVVSTDQEAGEPQSQDQATSPSQAPATATNSTTFSQKDIEEPPEKSSELFQRRSPRMKPPRQCSQLIQVFDDGDLEDDEDAIIAPPPPRPSPRRRRTSNILMEDIAEIEDPSESFIRPPRRRSSVMYSMDSKLEITYRPNTKVPIYRPPRQRQHWGQKQMLPRVNWGDLFFDLFYVAAAYNVSAFDLCCS